VWDFAGQRVYYLTHQFFLSPRALYLLRWKWFLCLRCPTTENYLRSDSRMDGSCD
jgi:hypothetical protein